MEESGKIGEKLGTIPNFYKKKGPGLSVIARSEATWQSRKIKWLLPF